MTLTVLVIAAIFLLINGLRAGFCMRTAITEAAMRLIDHAID